ncbi:hypothetical protein ILUMI_21896 [Ignelater luminosus]|uniref:A-kinase anchor protein 7-like phosphoesterase domain-containing protein n=1 Tax=Ignelater luminosus TaxID=2038154 RepID=A0A8K0CI36_IGNLU|nr:hypothetical protein ILUMI_21896 [Ignelater luminosus]
MGRMMGSTKPIRMWIDGKCFNIKKYKKLKKSSTSTCGSEETPGTSTMCNHNFIINPTDNGKLTTTFRLPSIYYVRLNSFPNFSLKKLESETNTEVSMPKNGNDGYIIVTGDNEIDVVNARETIQSVASEIREKQIAAQFISIPVHSEEVQRNFEQFKSEILSGDPIQGVDGTIFQSSLKLHLTVVVFALMDNLEKSEAITTLNDCKTEFISPLLAETGPLKIKVSGIDCMNDNLEKVNVLYANAKVDHESGEDILQKLVNGISDYFYERGLVRQYQDNVKLHVTLINTKYRKSSAETSPVKKRSKWQMKKQTFDARSIMEKYKDYYFGESVFDSVHLSYISSKGEDGFYKPLSIIKVQ